MEVITFAVDVWALLRHVPGQKDWVPLHLELYCQLVMDSWVKVSAVVLHDHQCVHHAGGQETMGLALVEE